MDEIKIIDLEVFARHGVLSEEKSLGQKFFLSIFLSYDIKTAGRTDNIYDTINYADVAHFANNFMKENSYNLLEALAQNLAEAILLKFKVDEIELEIKKPLAPIDLSFKNVSIKIKRKWQTVYLGIGSNLGDKQKNMNEAVKLLGNEPKIIIEKVSNFIISKPMGEVKQDNFLNGAIEIKTLLEPLELLKVVNDIENKLGRVREIHWGPRTIDIDILLYGDRVIRNEELIIPHYGMYQRDFVLQPMNEIAPQVIHPLLNQTIYQLLLALK